MGIGAISGIGSMSFYNMNNYRVNSVNGNPKSLNPVEKIGQESYNSKPFATVSKVEEDDQEIRAQQAKPFDFDAAMNRMMVGSRFNAENIPVVNPVEEAEA